MSENESMNSDVQESVKTEATDAAKMEVNSAPEKSKTGMYIGAIVIVVVTLLVVLFMLEKEGRSSTGIFDSYFASQESNATVAIVNDEEITGKDLNTSIQQFNQAALAQGVDISSPEVAADIRNQSLEVLVNTTLLRQAANSRGIEVTDEEAAERLETIEAEIGGAEVLQSRIDELGLTRSDLEEDIREEILIQTLLDSIFAEAQIEVTEEEIAEVYAAAGGVEAGLPPLDEVRDQVEAQVKGGKEQEVIDGYLDTLKADAQIELI
jgi:FKBP-type peptidyl-prolyl cis-trans isomerase (trigger factor)